MKPYESPEKEINQFVAIRAIRGLCGIGVIGMKHVQAIVIIS